jgi:hypothetical protein
LQSLELGLLGAALGYDRSEEAGKHGLGRKSERVSHLVDRRAAEAHERRIEGKGNHICS